MITNSQILAEALEDAKNPEFRDEALENIISIMTRNAEHDMKEDFFDVAVGVDKARAICTAIHETYFGFELNVAHMASIANSHHDIALMLSTVIGLLHDAVEAFQKYGIY